MIVGSINTSMRKFVNNFDLRIKEQIKLTFPMAVIIFIFDKNVLENVHFRKKNYQIKIF